MTTAAIVVAAGKGVRAGQQVPKQFALWSGKPVLRHSVETLANYGVSTIVVVIPENGEALAKEALDGIKDTILVVGGATRQDSVANGLAALNPSNTDRVLIHDAARPDIPHSVLDRLLEALEDHAGAVPVLTVIDSIAIDNQGMMTGSADRETLRRVQTPQAFRFLDIKRAHAMWDKEAIAGDDAQVLIAGGGTVRHVVGDEALKKLTYSGDFAVTAPIIRTGLGYDVHRLVDGEELWLGGLKLDHHQGLSGHSDADVALHAIVDALLGAAAAGDIGDHFPPSDPRWKGANSARFIEHAAKIVGEAGYSVGNVDLTIICEAPKIGPHRMAMRQRIADLLSVDIAQISVKATTTERLGFAGRQEGIAAQAIATIIKQG